MAVVDRRSLPTRSIGMARSGRREIIRARLVCPNTDSVRHFTMKTLHGQSEVEVSMLLA